MKYIVSMLDGYSRYMVCQPVPDLTSQRVGRAILQSSAVSSSNSSVLIQVTTSAEAAPGIQQHSGGQISFTMEMETLTHHQHHMRMFSGYNKEEIVEALTFEAQCTLQLHSMTKSLPCPLQREETNILPLSEEITLCTSII